MNKIGLLFIIILLISAYRFANSIGDTVEEISPISEVKKDKVTKVLNVAKSYLGTPYKFGGTTSNGMDCSGLVYTVFKDELGVKLPRSSRAMSTVGEKIKFSNIQKGDLLFFDIATMQGDVNHVGMVTSNELNTIKFIHSSTSKGVAISSLEEQYWKDAFAFAKRVKN